jgi:hypothetical protein
VTVKDILAQQDRLHTRGKWVSRIQEYDMEIRPTKMIKGQSLAKMIDEGNEKALNIDCVDVITFVLEKLEHHSLYSDIVYYLRNLLVQII